MSSWYGVGDFGVGDFSSDTEISFALLNGSSTAGGDIRLVPWPVFSAPGAASDARGDVRAQAWPVAAFLAGSSTARGHVWWILDPGNDETLFLPAAAAVAGGSLVWRLDMAPAGWHASGSFDGALRAVVEPVARDLVAGADAGGVYTPLLIQTLELEPGPALWPSGAYLAYPQARFEGPPAPGIAHGTAHANVWVGYGLDSAASEASGRFGPRMLFKALFLDGSSDYQGTVRVSYAWSNLTAPGREPVPPWADQDDPASDWGQAPALPNDWPQAPKPGNGWSLPVSAAGVWHEVERE